MNVLETDRLALRFLTVEDAPFILELVNDPSWLRFIGDRGVRTLEGARDYILKGPIAMYARLGFGLYLVELKESRTPIGLCGLIKRDSLDDVDIGFALLPAFRSKGYGYESAAAVLKYGREALGLRRVVAITSPENALSQKLLRAIGLTLERRITLPGDASEALLFGSSGA